MNALLLFKSNQFNYSSTNFCLGLNKYIQIAKADLLSFSDKNKQTNKQNLSDPYYFRHVLKKM